VTDQNICYRDASAALFVTVSDNGALIATTMSDLRYSTRAEARMKGATCASCQISAAEKKLSYCGGCRYVQ
jgi:hypothetical protein